MKNFTNRYIFFYITTLALFCIVLLTVVSVSLQSRKKSNRALEMKFQVLTAAGYNIPKTEAEALYREVTQEKEVNTLPYYEVQLDGKTAICYVFPLHGKGLWGPLWAI